MNKSDFKLFFHRVKDLENFIDKTDDYILEWKTKEDIESIQKIYKKIEDNISEKSLYSKIMKKKLVLYTSVFFSFILTSISIVSIFYYNFIYVKEKEIKIEYKEKIIEKPVEKIVYKDKIVEKIIEKPVEKIKNVLILKNDDIVIFMFEWKEYNMKVLDIKNRFKQLWKLPQYQDIMERELQLIEINQFKLNTIIKIKDLYNKILNIN